jgi:glycosyltransferase involved in cell wall biosynthesis
MICSVLEITRGHDGIRRYLKPYWKYPIFQRFRAIGEILFGIKIWLVSLAEPGPFLTYGLGHGFVFATLQYLFKPIRKPRRHFMFDLLLNPKRSGMWGVFDSVKMAIFKSTAKAFVWGKSDIRAYSESYGVDPSRFIFHEYHTTMNEEYPITDGGYIFAGGNALRDYHTAIEALKNVDFPVVIATTNPGVGDMADGCDHITVKGVSPDDFRKLLAGCSIFVECHNTNNFRTVGHQTFLNAMSCGKPVVLASPKAAEGYIEDQVTGIVVAAGDAQGVRDTVKTLLNSNEYRARLGCCAKRRTSGNSKDAVFRSIYKRME